MAYAAIASPISDSNDPKDPRATVRLDPTMLKPSWPIVIATLEQLAEWSVLALRLGTLALIQECVRELEQRDARKEVVVRLQALVDALAHMPYECSPRFSDEALDPRAVVRKRHSVLIGAAAISARAISAACFASLRRSKLWEDSTTITVLRWTRRQRQPPSSSLNTSNFHMPEHAARGQRDREIGHGTFPVLARETRADPRS